MSGDITNTRRTNWDVTWKTTPIGLVDKVDPTGLKAIYDAITVGTFGKMKLGDRFVGLDGTIKIQMREVTAANVAAMAPWATTGHLPVSPGINVDLYTLAGELVLHPHDLPAETLTEDIHLYKMVPITLPTQRPRDGMSDDVFEVEFQIYPDRSKLGTADNPYGYIGAAA